MVCLTVEDICRVEANKSVKVTITKVTRKSGGEEVRSRRRRRKKKKKMMKKKKKKKKKWKKTKTENIWRNSFENAQVKRLY